MSERIQSDERDIENKQREIGLQKDQLRTPDADNETLFTFSERDMRLQRRQCEPSQW